MSEEESQSFKVVPPAKRSSKRRRSLGFVLLGVCALGGILGALGAGLVYQHYAATVPVFESLEDYRPLVGTKIYSADDQLIGEFAHQRRVVVPIERIPRMLSQAFISAEDKRFYVHGGIDFIGVAQAIAAKVMNPSSKLRGASTISQQVAKSVLASYESYEKATERTLERKIREAILARNIESVLSKDEILFIYMNEIFLGHKAYGVQAAAEHYFRKNVWELSLAEMATFAGLPQRPSDYSPYSRPQAALARRKYVLRRLMEDGHITVEEESAAVAEELKVYPRTELYLDRAPYFTEQIRRMLVDRYGERAVLEDGLEVYTTLNLEAQVNAQDAINRGLLDLDQRQGFRGPALQLADASARKNFLERYREFKGLEGDEATELVDGEIYAAVVEGFTARGRLAKVNVLGTKGVLPLAGMRWARSPDPTKLVDYSYLKRVTQALKLGDVVWVSKSSRKELSKDRHGWTEASDVPKKGNVFKLYQEPIAQAALMSVDPETGYVVAQVGGYDFETSSFNRAMQACREPGSAFKPIVYSAAIDKLDYTASTLIEDKPLVFDDPENEMRWKPNNAGESFRGEIPMRTCLQDSINTPAIRITQAVGIRDILRNARRLGIRTPLKKELGTALGSSCTTLSDLMKVYATLNQGGLYRDPIFIRRVVSRDGLVLEDGSHPMDPTSTWRERLDAAYRQWSTPEYRPLDTATAFVMTSLLENVVKNGTAVAASRIGFPVAGKTGTTNDSYDAWFMGYSSNLVTGVWVGHDTKERPLGIGEYGGKTALPIWMRYNRKYYLDFSESKVRLKPPAAFTPPPSVVEVKIDPETGYLARETTERSVMEYFRKGTEPTEFTPDVTEFDPNEFNIFETDVPL